MNYEKFRQTFSRSKYIRLIDILMHYPDIDRKQLSRWSSAGLIHHPARGLYVLPEREIDKEWMMGLCGELVNPAYISLEYALSYYGLIPEEAVVITAITTKKTESYDLGRFGRYRYQSIVERGYLGYALRQMRDGETYAIATPAKAIIDFLYLHDTYLTSDDFESWRINTYEVQEQVTPEELRNLASSFCNKRLMRQVESFISFIW